MIVHFYNGDLAKRKGKINKRFMQDNFENLITHKDMQNMEEGIAASYLAAYLHIDYKQFEVRESPDLALTFDNKMVGVEITTLRPSIYMTFPMDKPSKGQSIQAVENAVRKIIYECMLDLNLFDLTMQIELEPELYFGGIQVKKVKELLKSSFMDIFANFSNDVVEIDSSKVLRSYKYGKPVGSYITVDIKKLKIADNNEIQTASETVTKELKELINKHVENLGDILVVGLGNAYVTPDSLRAKSCKRY